VAAVNAMQQRPVSAGRCDLSDGRIHVWSVHLEASSAVVDRFESFLAEDEARRSVRFRYEEHRRAFVVARGALRILLGRVLGAAPAAVRFHYGRHGKPRVVAAEHLEFSASDTVGLAMFAVARGCALGLDVEKIRPMPDAAGIVSAHFTAEEAASLASNPADESAFFRYWVCKEAYVKATGEGLTRPLNEFGLTFQRGESVVLEHISGDGDQAAGWTLQLLAPPAGYAAALAYRGGSRTVAAWPVLTAAEMLSIDR
jgi:4'-phosphopantetheinyl transferase